MSALSTSSGQDHLDDVTGLSECHPYLSMCFPGGGGGGGKGRFNVAILTNATVTCTAYVLPYNFQTKSI